MARFKNINGVSSQLTAEEETIRDAEEAVNTIAHQANLEVIAQKETDKTNAISKLEALGLTSSEINAFIK